MQNDDIEQSSYLRPTRKNAFLILLVLFPVLDVGTLFCLARFVGAWTTLAIVFVSSAVGLYSCKLSFNKMVSRLKEWEQPHKTPPDLVIIRANDLALTFVAMFLFLFPGLLSDILAWLLKVPSVERYLGEQFRQRIEQKAEAQGMTLKEYWEYKHSISNLAPNRPQH